jgi:hypothetical protein
MTADAQSLSVSKRILQSSEAAPQNVASRENGDATENNTD